MAAVTEMIKLIDGYDERTVHATVLAAGERVWKGAHAFQIAGKVYKAGAISTTLMLTAAGVDANGGIRVWSKQQNVRYSQVTGGANKTLGVDVVFNAATVDVVVQLGTDGAGAATSTANAVASEVRKHALASLLLKIGATGTGATATAAFAVTAVPHVAYLGVAKDTYDNSTSGVDQAGLLMSFSKCRVLIGGSSTDLPTLLDSYVAFVDDTTVKATLTPLDFWIRLVEIENGNLFVDGNSVI